MKIPKYLKIKLALQKQLQSNKFKHGDRFYTESEISQKYGVSSITAIRALNELSKEGYIIRRQGKGSFVSRSRKNKLVSFSDVEKFKMGKDTVTVLNITQGASSRILRKLELHEFEHYYRVERLRFVKDSPYMYHNTYLPSSFVKHDPKDFKAFESVYKRFKEDFAIHMQDEYMIETNEIIFPVPTDVKEKLQLGDTEPVVLQIRKTVSRTTQHVLEYIETYKHWNYYKIEIISNEF